MYQVELPEHPLKFYYPVPLYYGMLTIITIIFDNDARRKILVSPLINEDQRVRLRCLCELNLLISASFLLIGNVRQMIIGEKFIRAASFFLTIYLIFMALHVHTKVFKCSLQVYKLIAYCLYGAVVWTACTSLYEDIPTFRNIIWYGEILHCALRAVVFYLIVKYEIFSLRAIREASFTPVILIGYCMAWFLHRLLMYTFTSTLERARKVWTDESLPDICSPILVTDNLFRTVYLRCKLRNV